MENLRNKLDATTATIRNDYKMSEENTSEFIHNILNEISNVIENKEITDDRIQSNRGSTQ